MKPSAIALYGGIVTALLACSTPTTKLDLTTLNWTPEQLAAPIAAQPLPAEAHTENAGNHTQLVIRLMGSEPPHYHDKHDLFVEVLQGTSVVHFEDRTQELQAGDTLLIKKGTYHWAENTGPDPSVVIATFSPKMNEKDFRLAQEHKNH